MYSMNIIDIHEEEELFHLDLWDFFFFLETAKSEFPLQFNRVACE
jgi:hypothetical protein